jgi:predicted amidohydrolase
MSTLKISILQAALHWHDPARNCDEFEADINKLDDIGDLIVLPEMFTTGFTMEAQTQAERWNGPSVKWMRRIAAEKNVCLCGSLIIEDNGHFFNRFVAMKPDGSHVSYDKRHLFQLAGEHQHYSAGAEFVTFEINGFRICPMICYDLRFPVWSRNRDRYDVLLYVANWPSQRHLAWETLLRARAIENLAYVVGVNRVGVDGNQHPYSGGSAIIDYLGKDIEKLGDKKGIATASLDSLALEEFRQKLAFANDADDFLIST